MHRGGRGGGRGRGRGRGGGADAPPLTPREKEELDEVTIEEEVGRRMRKAEGRRPRPSRHDLALTDACLRAIIMKDQQTSLATIKIFQLSVDCTAQEFSAFLDLRRGYCRHVSAYQFMNRVAVTPPMITSTFNMVELMDSTKNPPESMVQLIFPDNSFYFELFRATPPGDRYGEGGFLRFNKVKTKFPQVFWKNSSTAILLREIWFSGGYLKGVIRMMAEKLQTFNTKSERTLDEDLVVFTQTPFFLFGECQRFSEAEEFTVENFDSPFPVFLTVRHDNFIHIWSRLSKLGFAFIVAILEFDKNIHNRRFSFEEAVKLLQEILEDYDGKLELNFRGDDGHFSLRRILGHYLKLLKFEQEYVIKMIMRSRHDVWSSYLERGSNEEATTQQERETAAWTNHEDGKIWKYWTEIQARGDKVMDVLMN
ncbi:hypothetical protein ACQJBY_012193 [Aegilops geniculata]